MASVGKVTVFPYLDLKFQTTLMYAVNQIVTYLNERTTLEAQKRNRIHIRTIFYKRSAKHQIELILYGNSF